MAIHIVTVQLAIDTSTVASGLEESAVVDCVNESLRGLQRDFNEESDILDYSVGEIVRSDMPVEGYEEGDAFDGTGIRPPSVAVGTYKPSNSTARMCPNT